jgi:inhibitor of KinA sporulation pathway (predicted exonuclease)
MINLRSGNIFCLVDLELISDEGSLEHRWSRKNDFPEIIEIGALKLIYKNNSFLEKAELLTAVKPKLHKTIPKYILNLTKKKPAYFNAGTDLKNALLKLNEFCSDSIYNFSNGVDGEIIQLNKTKFNISFRTPKILNIAEFLKLNNNEKSINSHSALEDCKIVLQKFKLAITNKKILNNTIALKETTYSPLNSNLILKYYENENN